MPHRPILILIGLAMAVGLPLYFVVIKKRAAASLQEVIAERFTARACPVGEVAVPSGGRVHCTAAYDDKKNSGLVLVLGNWERGAVKTTPGVTYVENKVSGIFKPGGDAGWLARVRDQPDVIATATEGGGALVVWKGLPTGDSVLAHLEAVR